MSNSENNGEKNRQELKNKRSVLFRLFLKHPNFTRLAVEIKALDDQLAEWTPEDALALSSDHGQRFPGRRPLLSTKASDGRNEKKVRQHREQILTGARLSGQLRRSA